MTTVDLLKVKYVTYFKFQRAILTKYATRVAYLVLSSPYLAKYGLSTAP